MRAKSKSAQAEDAMLAGEIAKAKRFSASLHLGPGDRHTRYIEQGGPAGYAEALAQAEDLNKLSRFGRRAIVYAINPLGSFPVSPELARLAGIA